MLFDQRNGIVGLDADAYGAYHIWCMIVANDYHGLKWIVGLCYKYLACAQGGAWTDWYILAYTKGKPNQRFQQELRGSMDSKERELLGLPFALDVKEGE